MLLLAVSEMKRFIWWLDRFERDGRWRDVEYAIPWIAFLIGVYALMLVWLAR